jgi:aminomethyltransferase
MHSHFGKLIDPQEPRDPRPRPSDRAARRRGRPTTMMTTELARTPLHDWHVQHGGRMVDFAGWSMPVQYTSIAEEHHATRNAVGVFDISHMGRLLVAGDANARFLDSVATRRISDIKPDQVRYSLLCNNEGGILDDVLIYGTSISARPMMVVVNASNRAKVVDWLNKQIGNWAGTSTLPERWVIGLDNTKESAMIAIQGPKAVEVLSPIVEAGRRAPPDLRKMRYYHYSHEYFDGVISRTGYTGEDGFEIICHASHAVQVWEQIVRAAEAVGGRVAGLGARDTLRLEAAMPLYGHELSEAINPIQAGLNFAVNLPDREFIGRDALVRFAADKNQPVRIGLQLEGRRVPRQGFPVLQSGEIIGEVTSGTFSPTLEQPIAMAYVRPIASAIGTKLNIDIRGTQHPATVVPLPFYKRERNN